MRIKTCCGLPLTGKTANKVPDAGQSEYSRSHEYLANKKPQCSNSAKIQMRRGRS